MKGDVYFFFPWRGCTARKDGRHILRRFDQLVLMPVLEMWFIPNSYCFLGVSLFSSVFLF